MKTFLRLIALRPYGNKLNDGVADIWLVFAMLNLAAVAVCEAIGWAYLGYTTATGWASALAAAILGTVAFILVGSLDASFIMHDTSAAARGTDEKASDGPFAWLRGHFRRNHLAVIVRVILVILSFTVTAPFLTQLFFSRDIDAAIERKNAQSVAERRAQLVAANGRALGELRNRLAGRLRDLEAEIAGTGRSARYGDGPAAEAIRTDVATLKTEISNTEGLHDRELRSYDNASPEERAKRWGVDVEREGPDTRARAVAEMEKSPAFRTTRRTIKAFLIFLFLGLVSLKLFQPASVKVYFNAELQAAYRRLEAGIFDGQLDPREHAGVGMAPLHFARWYEQRQRLRDATEAMRDRAAELTERLKVQEEAYATIQKKLMDDLAGMKEDFNGAAEAASGLEQELTVTRTELAAVTLKIREQEQELRDFAQLGDDLSLRERHFLVDGRMKAAKALATYRLRLDELTAKASKLASQLDASRAYGNTINLAIEQSGRDLIEVNRLIAEVRQQTIRDLK